MVIHGRRHPIQGTVWPLPCSYRSTEHRAWGERALSYAYTVTKPNTMHREGESFPVQIIVKYGSHMKTAPTYRNESPQQSGRPQFLNTPAGVQCDSQEDGQADT